MQEEEKPKRKPIPREGEVIKMGGGKKRREKAERTKKHAEYLREKKLKRKETKAKLQAPVKKKKK